MLEVWGHDGASEQETPRTHTTRTHAHTHTRTHTHNIHTLGVCVWQIDRSFSFLPLFLCLLFYALVFARQPLGGLMVGFEFVVVSVKFEACGFRVCGRLVFEWVPFGFTACAPEFLS